MEEVNPCSHSQVLSESTMGELGRRKGLQSEGTVPVRAQWTQVQSKIAKLESVQTAHNETSEENTSIPGIDSKT